MGALFQLAFFIVAYSILAIIVGLILYVVIRVAARIWNGNTKAAKQGFWLPIKLAPYFLFALIFAVVVCEVRDVTPPLTDYWSFQLGKNTSMGAIDTLDSWTIWPGSDGGEGIVSDVSLFGFNEKSVYGITKSNVFFVYRMEPHKFLKKLSEKEFDVQLNRNGWSRENLKSPTEYYYENRYLGDLITVIVILFYPLFRLYKLALLFFDKGAFTKNDKSRHGT